MKTTFIGVLEFGDVIRVDDAWCPNCGRVRPEGLRFPFTADADVFRAMQPDCPVCGARLELDAEGVDGKGVCDQHVVIHTDDRGSRIAVDVRPINGSYYLGVTPATPDFPSGMAPGRPLELPPWDRAESLSRRP